MKALLQRDALNRLGLAFALSAAMLALAFIFISFYEQRHDGLISLFFVGREAYDDEIVTIAVTLVCGAGLMPFLAIASIISRQFLLRRSRKSLDHLAHAARRDDMCDHDAIRDRTREIYADIATAMTTRDTGPLQRSLTERLLPGFEQLVRRLIARRWRNEVRHSELDIVHVVDVMNAPNGMPQRLVVLVAGTHEDRTVEETTGKPVEDFSYFRPVFAEFWRVVRGHNGWMLDETGGKVSNFVVSGFAQEGAR